MHDINAEVLHSDPMWLRFDNSDNATYINEIRISWLNNFGQIAELEVAVSKLTKEKIHIRPCYFLLRR